MALADEPLSEHSREVVVAVDRMFDTLGSMAASEARVRQGLQEIARLAQCRSGWSRLIRSKVTDVLFWGELMLDSSAHRRYGSREVLRRRVLLELTTLRLIATSERAPWRAANRRRTTGQGRGRHADRRSGKQPHRRGAR